MQVKKVSEMIAYLQGVLENDGDKYCVNNVGFFVSVSRNWDDDICFE